MNKIYLLQRMNYNYNLPAKALFFISPLFFGHLAKGMEQVVPVARNFPLHDAAKAGNVEWMKELVQEGKIIAMPDQNGDAPLHCAAEAGNIEAINCLIDLGADLGALNLAGYTPLMKAKSPEVVAHLKHRGAKEQAFVKPEVMDRVRLLARAQLEGAASPLHWASSEGYRGIVEALLAAGADKESQDENGFRPLHDAAAEGHVDVVKALLAAGVEKEAQNLAGETPLHRAAAKGQTEVVKALLMAGVGIEAEDIYGKRALHNAAYEGCVNVVKVLLAAGADKEARRKDDFASLLHVASVRGLVDVVKVLLAAGFDKEAQSADGSRPLHWAAKAGQVEVVEVLLAAGSEIEAQDCDGAKALHWASHFGHVEIMKALLAAGADKEAQDKDGSRPLHMATAEGQVEAVKVLLAALADKEAQDHCGMRPLHNAAIFGHREAVRVLLVAGVAKDAQDINGATPLHLAVATRRVEVIKELLARGTNRQCRLSVGDRWFPNMTPYEIAQKRFAGLGDQTSKDAFKNILELLLEPSTDDRALQAAEPVAQNAKEEKSSDPIEGPASERKALDNADSSETRQGFMRSDYPLRKELDVVDTRQAKVTDFLAVDVEIDSQDKPLQEAILADIDSQHEAILAEVDSQDKIFHEAIIAGQVEKVKALLAAGVEKESKTTSGYRPLHWAAYAGQAKVVKALLVAGAEKEAQSVGGYRPLHLAAHEGHAEVIKVLLAHGANKQCRLSVDSSRFPHMTPYEIAQKRFAGLGDQRSKDAFKKILELLSEPGTDDHYTLQAAEPAAQSAKEEKSSAPIKGAASESKALDNADSIETRRWLMRPDYLLRKEVDSAADSAQKKKALFNLLDYYIRQADSEKVAECAAELTLPAESSRILRGSSKGEKESPFMDAAEIEKMVQESNDLNLRAELWLRLADTYYFNIRNYARACENYEKVANQNTNLLIQAIALVRLGELFSINHVNYETAESYLLRAAAQSANLEMQALAWVRLAWIYYFHKEGTTADIKRAVHYFELAAAQTVNAEVYVAANIMLGCLHYHGRIFNDIPADKVKARMHYERVAAQTQNLEAKELAMRRLEEIKKVERN